MVIAYRVMTLAPENPKKTCWKNGFLKSFDSKGLGEGGKFETIKQGEKRAGLRLFSKVARVSKVV